MKTLSCSAERYTTQPMILMLPFVVRCSHLRESDHFDEFVCSFGFLLSLSQPRHALAAAHALAPASSGPGRPPLRSGLANNVGSTSTGKASTSTAESNNNNGQARDGVDEKLDLPDQVRGRHRLCKIPNRPKKRRGLHSTDVLRG